MFASQTNHENQDFMHLEVPQLLSGSSRGCRHMLQQLQVLMKKIWTIMMMRIMTLEVMEMVTAEIYKTMQLMLASATGLLVRGHEALVGVGPMQNGHARTPCRLAQPPSTTPRHLRLGLNGPCTVKVHTPCHASHIAGCSSTLSESLTRPKQAPVFFDAWCKWVWGS